MICFELPYPHHQAQYLRGKQEALARKSATILASVSGFLSSQHLPGDHMNPTKNDLPPKTRTKIIELLNQSLADLIDLQLQSKQAHWNVKGPQFIALHELFDDVAGKAAEFSDIVRSGWWPWAGRRKEPWQPSANGPRWRRIR